MLTLSDELKIYYDLDSSYKGQNVSYTLAINPDDDQSESITVYQGQIYYMNPAYLYYKDIILPYVTDYSWLKNLPQHVNYTSGIFEFTVTVNFSNGSAYTTDTIQAITTVPTVVSERIPSVLPIKVSEDSEFFFGWLAPTVSTRIYRGVDTDSPYVNYGHLESLDNPGTGHMTCKYNWGDYTATNPIQYGKSYCESLWRYTLDGTYTKIAEYDEHNSRFYLIWITRDNDYMCRPFCQRYDLKESVSTSYMTSLTDHNVPYIKSSDFKWTLNSDWLTYSEHNVYESLLISPVVYLYDNETGKLFAVNVTNSEWTEKNSQNNRKPFNLTVSVQLDQKQNLTY